MWIVRLASWPFSSFSSYRLKWLCPGQVLSTFILVIVSRSFSSSYRPFWSIRQRLVFKVMPGIIRLARWFVRAILIRRLNRLPCRMGF